MCLHRREGVLEWEWEWEWELALPWEQAWALVLANRLPESKAPAHWAAPTQLVKCGLEYTYIQHSDT